MSDEALRALERAARSAPADLAAGRAYTEALRRAGRRQELFHELCRLMRAGDKVAHGEVLHWWPWPGPDGPGSTRCTRALPPERMAMSEPWWPRFPIGSIDWIAHAGELLLLGVGSRRSVVAIDTSSREAVWRAGIGGRSPPVLVGEWLVHANDRGRLALTQLADGSCVHEIGLSGRVEQLEADGDRLAVLLRPKAAPRVLLGLDLGPAGPCETWEVSLEWEEPYLSAHHGRVVVGDGDEGTVLDLETGQALGTSAPPLAGDESGLVTAADLNRFVAGPERLRWLPGEVALTPTRSLVRVMRDLRAFDRATGQMAWSARLPSNSIRVVTEPLVVVGESTFLGLVQGGPSGDTIGVGGWDQAGRTMEVDGPIRLSGGVSGVRNLWVIPREGGLLLIWQDHANNVAIARMGEP